MLERQAHELTSWRVPGPDPAIGDAATGWLRDHV
jgi:hypothetical protein